jgi:hypothetical protein
MNLDSGQINQMLSMIPYPVGKAQLVQFAQEHNTNAQIMTVLQMLPDKTYNSAQDIQNDLGSLGSLGNLGNLGGFKL